MIEAARAHCYRCDKPAIMCLCERIPRVEHRTAVTIVQHPRERAHPFGTARIARLGLARCEVLVAQGEARASFERRRVIPAFTIEPGTVVLYPRAGAPALESLSVEERPPRIVVLDGTWAQAKRLWADNPGLAALRCVRLDPTVPSRYRIRREPRPDAISTLEAVVTALSILEPERASALSALLASFDAMIDDQLARRSRPSPRHKRRRRSHAPPAALLAPLERLVVVGAEHRRARDGTVAMARLSALRLDGPETFDVFVGALPSAARIEQIGVAVERYRSAVDEASALAQLGMFLRPRDVVLSWHGLPLRRIASVLDGHRALELESAVCNRAGRRSGALDELVARLGLVAEPPRLEGRMGPWLANTACIVHWLRGGAEPG